mmetsp:Transcript_1490/g.2746  ORF Transcript_1490/g.2746 Transcript_1490/m.2746 type:complete len:283 (-) Transcript_1490:208-1056(-)
MSAFQSALRSFRASVRVCVEGPTFADPEEVFGDLRVYKTKFRLDCYPDGDDSPEGEVAECISLIRSRDFADADVAKVHTDRRSLVRQLEENFRAMEADDPEDGPETVEKLRGCIQTFELFHLAEALRRASNAEEDEDAWPKSVNRYDRKCFATPFGDDGVRFVYVWDMEIGAVEHIEQIHEDDIGALMHDALNKKSETKPTSSYRVYMTLENMEPCSVNHGCFVVPAMSSIGDADISMSKSTVPAEVLKKATKCADDRPMSGTVDLDAEIGVPFDQFWKEFL